MPGEGNLGDDPDGGAGAGGMGSLPTGGREGAGGTSGGPGHGVGGAGGEATGGRGESTLGIPEPHCTAEEEAFAYERNASLPFAGFEGEFDLGSEPVLASVVKSAQRSITLEREGLPGSFTWPSSLPIELPVGAEVRLARRGNWTILVSEQGTLAALWTQGMGSLGGRFPEEPSKLLIATHCRFPLDPTPCDEEPPYGSLLSVVPSYWGAVVARPGMRAVGEGWTVDNHVVATLPGCSSDTHVTDSFAWALVTAFTPHAMLAPF